MSQRNLNMSMVTAGLMVIPGLFTAFASIKTILPKTTAETFTLGGALDFLSANPIVLVIAGIAALVAALVLIPGACGAVINAFLAVGNAIRTVANDIGGWFGGVIGMLNGADAKIADSAKTLKTAVESTTPSMTAAEFQTGIMMQAVQGFEDAVKSVDDTLLTSNEILATNAATLSEYKDKATAAGDEVNVIDTKIADLNKTYADSKGALDTQLMGMQAVSVFMPGVTTNIDQLKTKEAELKSQLDTTIGSLESSKTAFEAQQKAANDAISDIDSLTKKYDDMKASADTNLGAVKAAFDSAFNAGDMAKAYGIVNDFGEKYGLVFADAEKIVESFKAAQAEVPKSIEEQLIGKAQADLKAFQECATGKFTGMQEDSSASVKQLVADTNDLIAHGLVGQAQDNIKAYVTCATDKHAQLVSNIEADLAKLRKDYAAGATDLAPMIKQLEEFKLAATMGQPGVDIYAAIKLAGKTASEVAAQTETATTQITASFQGMANNAIMHAQRLQDSLVGHSVWTDMLQKMEDTTEKSVAKIHKQFQTLQAEGIAGGGFGVPETLPGSGGGKAQVVNNVTITVQGNADKATMDYAVNKVFEKLKGVVIEPTSSHASAMSKMIRQGSVF